MRRRRPRHPSHPVFRRRRIGWDEVRTPFGVRIVPRGEGWREAAKWALWRAASWIALIAILGAAVLWTHLIVSR